MQVIDILSEIQIKRTPRVIQLEGIFDISQKDKSIFQFSAEVDLDQSYNIGLIVGPSGSGKTSIAKKYFSDNIIDHFNWSKDKCILDDFPKELGIKDLSLLLSSIGFSSPPSWLRPFHVLSNGEQFRVNIARSLAENKDKLFVIDEFTSVVDRQVAQVACHSIQKSIRKNNQQFIALSCHYDIVDWLQPDWILNTETREFVRRSPRRKPDTNITIRKVHHSMWNLFKEHHYLTADLNNSAHCYCAFIGDRPIAFDAWLPMFGHNIGKAKRSHRTVCLPDFQGIGIGYGLFRYMAAAYKTLGYRCFSATAHPAEVKKRISSGEWKINRHGKSTTMDGGKLKQKTRATNRLITTSQYIGEKIDYETAFNLVNGKIGK